MLARLDWRTREAKLLVAIRAELVAHLGGKPNAVQRALIERAARLTVYIETMDRQALEEGGMSERNSKQYLAWIGQLRLTLREIGIDRVEPDKPASLSDYLAGKAASS
jgi:hypothetical protein